MCFLFLAYPFMMLVSIFALLVLLNSNYFFGLLHNAEVREYYANLVPPIRIVIAVVFSLIWPLTWFIFICWHILLGLNYLARLVTDKL